MHTNHNFKALSIAEAASAAAIRVAKLINTKVGDLKDQIERSAISFSLNLAEARGRKGKDRARICAIAYGSALETKQALRIVLTLGLAPAEDVKKALELVDQVAAVTYVLSRKT